MHNIDVKIINESYTSLTSFIDNWQIIKKEKYLGKRIYRGLFKASNNKVINAYFKCSMQYFKKK